MAIHHEVRVGASPKAVYDVLTSSEKFARMTGGRGSEDLARRGRRGFAVRRRHPRPQRRTRPGQARRAGMALGRAGRRASIPSFRFELSGDGKRHNAGLRPVRLSGGRTRHARWAAGTRCTGSR